MSREFTREAVMKFLPAPFSWNWCKCLSLIHSKISNLTKYEEVLVRYSLLITHADLTPVTGTTTKRIHCSNNQFMESCEVRLTWFAWRIISSEKWFNCVVIIIMFLKMPKIWVGRTTRNGDKKKEGLSRLKALRDMIVTRRIVTQTAKFYSIIVCSEACEY